jgi:putative flippase GtrA
LTQKTFRGTLVSDAALQAGVTIHDRWSKAIAGVCAIALNFVAAKANTFDVSTY